MFHSFFPKPRLYFISFAVWGLFCVIAWFVAGRDLGSSLSLGNVLGFAYPEPLAADADKVAKDAFAAAQKWAVSIWYYQYLTISFLAFVVFWMRYSPHKWMWWSVGGSALIVFVTWYQVQVDVMLNAWFGRFYNTIQKALAKPDNIEPDEFWEHIWFFLAIVMVYMVVAVLNGFFTKHYTFRWRTAMNDFYMERWDRLRDIEGASQRVQEDAKRFAIITESLGGRFLDAVMTLLAFLPILWVLSEQVKVLPVLGEMPKGLVFVAILWALGGTVLLASVGIKLPGLEFRNQRVEAAYRKELVLGEDHETRAQPPTIAELFNNVRVNYFRLFFHYMYFDVARYSYLQFSVLVPYMALAPTIIAGTITLGVMQQIVRAFGKVEASFQFLVHSWTTIVELISIYKRLAAFEATLQDRELGSIEHEPFEPGIGQQPAE
ncbi:MAG: peptide antibiotic transporter SbmA [Hyphomicrobiaceae bacterium]